MRKAILISLIAAVAVLGIACGGSNNGNSNGNANSNVAGGNDNAVAVKTPTPEQTTNDAPTLTPVFKAYCEAMNKKDEAALRKIYSADTIKNFEEQMKDNKVKSLMKFLEDDKVGKTCEVRNEVITGDSAVAEIRAESYPNGIKVVFVKEGGEWKITNRSPALDSMKTSPANSNTNTAK
ncbi:MAG TPA: nuclear transport factor 2 family protein [Pyrinomonadaceae bacterium]|jgi:hypothetical protein|nr:nuclear transport factor 2 family protein [Pyrinomonadaceae bacterium]